MWVSYRDGRGLAPWTTFLGFPDTSAGSSVRSRGSRGPTGSFLWGAGISISPASTYQCPPQIFILLKSHHGDSGISMCLGAENCVETIVASFYFFWYNKMSYSLGELSYAGSWNAFVSPRMVLICILTKLLEFFSFRGKLPALSGLLWHEQAVAV